MASSISARMRARQLGDLRRGSCPPLENGSGLDCLAKHDNANPHAASALPTPMRSRTPLLPAVEVRRSASATKNPLKVQLFLITVPSLKVQCDHREPIGLHRPRAASVRRTRTSARPC